MSEYIYFEPHGDDGQGRYFYRPKDRDGHDLGLTLILHIGRDEEGYYQKHEGVWDKGRKHYNPEKDGA